MTQKRIALITGATSGIGEATARLLAKNNFSLILCGRRKDRLEKIKNELSKETEVITLSFDVRNKEEVKNEINSLAAEWKAIDVLINNGGISQRSLIAETDFEVDKKLIAVFF